MDAILDKAELARVLFERADVAARALSKRAAETEALRRVPDQSIAELVQAELFKAARPARYGGFELDLDAVIEIISRLGRGCGSTAWVFGIFCDHSITMGMMPAEAQDDIWGEEPETLVSSGLMPAGQVERTEGGYRLTGRWQFSSGCDHAAWVFVQSTVPPTSDGERPTPAYFLLPRADYDRAFVPEHRSQSLALFNSGTGPGGEINPGAIYRLPRIATVPFSLVAPAIGILDSMIDGFTARTRERATRGFRHAELTTIQLRLAESSAERDCARLLLRRATQETMARMHANGGLSLDQRARNRRDMAYIAMLCVRAADRLFQAIGASGLFDGNDMRRMQADIHAIGAHHINSWDISGPIYGQVAFGLEPTNPLV